MPWNKPINARKSTTAYTAAPAPSSKPASARPSTCKRIRPLAAKVMPRIFLRWPMRDAPTTGVTTVPRACSERASPTTKSEPESRNKYCGRNVGAATSRKPVWPRSPCAHCTATFAWQRHRHFAPGVRRVGKGWRRRANRRHRGRSARRACGQTPPKARAWRVASRSSTLVARQICR